VKSVWTELALQNDFGFVLERIGNDAGIGHVDDAAGVGRSSGIVLDLELPLERVGLPQPRTGDDVTFEQQPLPLPSLTLRQHLVHVLEILGPFAQR
jgi:hypothetical protein